MVKGIPGRERKINKDLEERAVIISLLHPFSTWKIFFSLPGRSLVSWNLSKVVMLSFLSSLQGQRLQEHESLKKTSPLFFYAVTVAPLQAGVHGVLVLEWGERCGSKENIWDNDWLMFQKCYLTTRMLWQDCKGTNKAGILWFLDFILYTVGCHWRLLTEAMWWYFCF